MTAAGEVKGQLTSPAAVPSSAHPSGLRAVPDSEMPEPVCDAWALLLRAAGGEGVDYLDGDEALSVVEAAEVLKAWVESVSLAATAQLVYRVEADVVTCPSDVRPSSEVFAAMAMDARRAAASEIEAATGLGILECQARVGFADHASHERTHVLRAGLRAGSLSWAWARTLWAETRHCDPQTADAIASRVLTSRPDGAPLSGAQVRRRLARQLVLADVDYPRRRRADALSRRGTTCTVFDDGTGALTLTGATERVTAAAARIDALARAFAGKGLRKGSTTGPIQLQRTLASLRSDVALDLLLYGWPEATNTHSPDTALGTTAVGTTALGTTVPGTTVPGTTAPGAKGRGSTGTNTSGTGTSGTGTSGTGSTGTGTTDDGEGLAAGPDRGFLMLDTRPAAHVKMTMSLATALGLSDAPAEIPGYGFVQADHAREIALTAGSIWTRIVTDPLTGHAIEASTGSYRVPAAMAALVDARDGTCRGPGCTIEAARCDQDHERPWAPRGAGGPTSAANLNNKHRRHHNLKTSRFWSSTMDPGGVVHWTTAVGRTYTTEPFDYDDPDNQPLVVTEPNFSIRPDEIRPDEIRPQLDPEPGDIMPVEARAGDDLPDDGFGPPPF
ncbi:MAG TPA: HNH endonuclease signature motif containing protein [Dermatophilaceae bacterium]